MTRRFPPPGSNLPRVALLATLLACGCPSDPAGTEAPATAALDIPRIEAPEPVDAQAALTSLRRGRQLFAARRIGEAQQAFTEATEQDAGLTLAWHWLGRSYMVKSDVMSLSRAIDSFRHALGLDPELLESHWGIGLSAFGLTDYETARLHLSVVLAGDTDLLIPEQLGEVHHFLGVMLLNEGNPEQAIPQLLEARKLHPRFSETRYQLGLACEELEKAEEALGYYRETTEVDPNHVSAHHRLSKVLARLGRDEEAEREQKIHELLNQLTDNISSRFARDVNLRLQLQEELIALYPTNDLIRMQQAQLLLKRGIPLESARVLDALIRDMPEVEEGYVLRAHVAMLMGDRQTARGCLDRLLITRPSYPVEQLPKNLRDLLPQ